MCCADKRYTLSGLLKLCICVLSVVALCFWCHFKACAPSSSSSRPPQASSSAASTDKARKAGAALSAAAAAAAASCGGKPAPPPAAAAAAAGGSGSSSGPRMFDVGSAGGYYTEKSPKLMLHEWCTQQKRPKPKYKAVAVDPDKGGGYK